MPKSNPRHKVNWEIEYMTEELAEASDEDEESIKNRVNIIRRANQNNADEFAKDVAEEHEEWLEEFGYSYSSLSREASEERRGTIADLRK